MSSRDISIGEASPSDTNAGVDPLRAISIASRTDIGLRREENQDSFGILETATYRLVVVADGMGGVKGGAVASSIAISTLREMLQEQEILDEQKLTDAVHQANAKIFEESVTNPSLTGMGTTLVALGFVGTDLLIANVGDSRAYRIRGKEIHQLTEDHTLVMELLRSGAISPEQAENHPVSHMLTRSLGPAPEVEVDCWRSFENPRPGDAYLLCSDGLYNLVREEEIVELLASSDSEEVTKKLIDLANERGGSDNITVILVRVGNGYPLVEQEPVSIPVAEAVSDAEAQELNALHTKSKSEGGRNQSEPAPREKRLEPSIEGSSSSEVREAPKDLANTARERKTTTDPVQHVEAIGGIPNAISREEVQLSSQGGDSQRPTAPQNARVVTPTSQQRLGEIGGHVLALFKSYRNFTSIVLGALLVGGVGGAFLFGNNEPEPLSPPVVVQTPRINPLTALHEESIGKDTIKREEKSQERVGEENNEIARKTQTSEQVPSQKSQIPVDYSSELGIGEDLSTLSSRTYTVESTTTGELKNQPLDLTPEQVQRVVRRREVVLTKVRDLTAKIESFDRPFSGNVGKVLSDAEVRIETYQKELEEVKLELDKATRKLAVWYQRKKQIKESDPLNYAATVALVSDEVKRRHEQFLDVTAQYIREADALILNPSDQKQSRKVAELITLRREKMSALSVAVREAIDKEISSADQKVAELSLSRDKIELSLQDAARDVTYAKVLVSTDVAKKTKLRDEMLSELTSAKAEFDSLTHLLPPGVLKSLPSEDKVRVHLEPEAQG